MSEEKPTLDLPPAKKAKLEKEIVGNDDYEPTQGKSSMDAGEFSKDDHFNEFVTPEEFEKLREFRVLDEVKSNDEDSNDEESDSSDGKSEGLPEEEIEKMLEEDLPEGFRGAPNPKAKPYITRQKIVLEEKGVNHWEVLPLDWMMVRHYSGMPVYMHRTSRVCTLGKPYFLGKGNTRRHDIPISAIPCLAYKRALEEELKQQVIDKNIEEQIKNGSWAGNPNAPNSTHCDTNSDTKKDKIRDVDNDAAINVEQKFNDKMLTCPMTGKAIDKNVSRKSVEPSDVEMIPAQRESDEKSSIYSAIKTSGTNVTPKSIEQIYVDMFKEKRVGDISDARTVDKVATCPVSGNIGLLVPYKQVDIEMVPKQHDDNVSTVRTEGGFEAADSTDSLKYEKTATVTDTDKIKMDADNTSNDTNKINIDVDMASNTVPMEIPKNRQPVVLPGGIVMPAPKVETINNSWKTQHLSHEQVNDYCKKLFKFKTVTIMHFNRWADRRKYTKARKTLQYPTLPDGTKLITIPATPANGQEGGKPVKRDWVMNVDGRSYLSVFHEYVRRALQKQPVYVFMQLENAATPYQATVYIGGMQYGVGLGSSKRQAKSAAARASINILIPELKDEEKAPAKPNEPVFTFFDHVGIEDPRISEFCAATCEPSPHAILRTCLLRNFGANDQHIHTEMKKLEFQKIELTMKVGKHSATVVCKNKKTAKQRASQTILQALHPHVRSWGSLLRLYGSRSLKSCKERKLEEQQITLLQDRAARHQPNHAVLGKLRLEMSKLAQRDKAVVPIGTLLLQDSLPTHSGSNLNNVDL